MGEDQIAFVCIPTVFPVLEGIVAFVMILLAAVPAALSFLARPASSGKKAAPVFYGVLLTLEIIWLISGIIVVVSEYPNSEYLQAAAATIPHIILVFRLFRDR